MPIFGHFSTLKKSFLDEYLIPKNETHTKRRYFERSSRLAYELKNLRVSFFQNRQKTDFSDFDRQLSEYK